MGHIQRPLRRSTGRNVSVQVGTGQDNHQGTIRVRFRELVNRPSALSGMQGDQCITGLPRICIGDRYPMAVFAQQRSPAVGSDSVAFPGTGGSGCYNQDSHQSCQAGNLQVVSETAYRSEFARSVAWVRGKEVFEDRHGSGWAWFSFVCDLKHILRVSNGRSSTP